MDQRTIFKYCCLTDLLKDAMSRLPAPLNNLPLPIIGSPLFIISNPKLVIEQCKRSEERRVGKECRL